MRLGNGVLRRLKRLLLVLYLVHPCTRRNDNNADSLSVMPMPISYAN